MTGPTDVASIGAYLASMDAANGALPRPIRLSEAPAPKPIRWLVDNLLIADELGLFVGDGGSYKTTVALALACAIACGAPAFGQFRVLQGPVLFVSEEDSLDVLSNRVDALIAGHGWPTSVVRENLHVLALAGISLGEPKWRAHLEELVAEIDARAVIFDPWADFLAGLDENSNSDVGPVVKWMRALPETTGATPVVAMHLGKFVEGRRAIDRIRGASRIVHAARQIYAFDDRPSGIAMDCLKLSRAQKPSPMRLARAVASDPTNRAIWEHATITLSDIQDRSVEGIRGRMVAYVKDHPNASTNAVVAAAGCRREIAMDQLTALANDGELVNLGKVAERGRGAKWMAR